jgi:hypothetical protein
MSPEKIFGIKKVNKKTTEYFSSVKDGEVIFTKNPIQGFTNSDALVAKTMADLLSVMDKRNTYETYPITIG